MLKNSADIGMLPNGEFFHADNDAFTYMGRMHHDATDRTSTFIYAGSMMKTRFTSKSISVSVSNLHFYGENHIGYLIDGIQGKVILENHSDIVEYKIADNLSDGEHELILFKRMDATHYFTFHGLILDDNAEVRAIENNSATQKRLECFGDSVSAGAVCEAIYYEGHIDPEDNNGQYDNSWFSYSMSLARKLDAHIHNNAQGGIALLDNTGFFNSPNTVGLVSTYDKLHYSPNVEITDWDFSLYTPHVVIMAIGQNDSHPNNECLKDDSYRQNWMTEYKKILSRLRTQYPKATFVLITTVLYHDKVWDETLDEIRNEMNDERILRFRFRRNGSGTPGHPRITEQEEMASELCAFLESLPQSTWED